MKIMVYVKSILLDGYRPKKNYFPEQNIKK